MFPALCFYPEASRILCFLLTSSHHQLTSSSLSLKFPLFLEEQFSRRHSPGHTSLPNPRSYFHTMTRGPRPLQEQSPAAPPATFHSVIDPRLLSAPPPQLCPFIFQTVGTHSLPEPAVGSLVESVFVLNKETITSVKLLLFQEESGE